MSAHHRNPRRRKRSNALDGSPFRLPIAAGILLSENPNAGKRGAAQMLDQVSQAPDIAFRTLHAS